MIKDLRLTIAAALFTIFSISNVAYSGSHKGNSFVLTVPVVSLSRDSALGGEFNLSNKGTIGIEYISLMEGEELRQSELDNSTVEGGTADSLWTSGSEFRLMVSRYSRSAAMGGWFWSMGIGMRTVNGTWSKAPNENDPEQFGLEDEQGKVNHNIKITGNTLAARAGYRYVGSSGFLAGIHIGIRHFQNKVVDVEQGEGSEATNNVDIASEDAGTLKRRLMSSMAPQIQLGWAF